MKVPELPGTIQGSRVEYDVIVDMRPIRMGSYNEGMVALSKPLGQLLANGVCFFRRHFSGLEGLPDLVGDHVPLVPPSGDVLILAFCQQELLIRRHGVALISGDKLPFFGLFRVLGVISSVPEALGNALALVDVQGDQSRGGHTIHLDSI